MYIRAAFAEDGAVRDALLQAYALNSLVVILDGADEAAALRTPLETLVLRRLDRMRVVLSSRPQDLNGVDVARFQHYVILDLKPLSAEQQPGNLLQLANAERFKHMAAFSEYGEHDRIFTEAAFPVEAERREIEAFELANLFFGTARAIPTCASGSATAPALCASARPRSRVGVPAPAKRLLLRPPACRAQYGARGRIGRGRGQGSCGSSVER